MESQTCEGNAKDLPHRETSGSKARKVHVAGSFLRSSTEVQNARQERLKAFLASYYVANFMVAVVLLDAYSTCTDIDARAAGSPPPQFFLVISDVCLVLYSLEILGMVLVFGVSHLSDWMIMVDAIIVACGWAEKVLASVGTGGGIGFRTAVLRAMRLVRIFRIMRVLKRIRPLRELHKLVMMMATCVRTLLWSFLLCFVVMTVWGMLMVELVNPAVQDMQRTQGTFDGCKQCQTAMSSVMQANLLLTKTVIAGDSWGEIAVPVIQEHPATAIIFIGSLLTLVFGVLNIIVAVVVDTFADARQNDLQNLAEEMEDEIEHDRKALAKLFAKIDKDNSGQLTLQELIEGARQDPGFQSRLRVMDIDENDLHQLFQMIDMDRSGTIEVAEFIGPLSRWAHDSKTAPRFIKYNMLQTMHLQEDLYALSEDCFENLAKRVDDLALQISALGKIGYGTRQNESRPESRHESKLRGPAGLPGGPGPSNPSNPSPSTPLTCVGSDGILSSNLGLWTRHATEEVASTKSTQQEADQVDQPRTSTVGEFLSPKTSKAEKNHMNDLDLLESLLESSMAKLESKLDVLLDRSRMKVPEVGLGSEDVESWKGGACT